MSELPIEVQFEKIQFKRIDFENIGNEPYYFYLDAAFDVEINGNRKLITVYPDAAVQFLLKNAAYPLAAAQAEYASLLLPTLSLQDFEALIVDTYQRVVQKLRHQPQSIYIPPNIEALIQESARNRAGELRDLFYKL